jgi:hypothetical protein
MLLPFDTASTVRVDLRDNVNNQATPFFLSDKGRFLWSDAPFVLNATPSEVICEGEEPVRLYQGHKTLRGAFFAARLTKAAITSGRRS